VDDPPRNKNRAPRRLYNVLLASNLRGDGANQRVAIYSWCGSTCKSMSVCSLFNFQLICQSLSLYMDVYD
jgi:hypothetical protein